MRMKRAWISTFVVLCGTTSLLAESVNVKGVHLCCGACVKDATAALDGIDKE